MRLIDADKAYNILTDYYHHKTDIQHQSLIEALNRVPTIYPPMGYKVLADGRGWAYYGKEEVEPVRHGRWIDYKSRDWSGGGAWKCSSCGYGYSWAGYHEANEFSYCPNCGARMEAQG